MKKPKTQRHAEAGQGAARDRILRVAEQVFAEMGFDGASLRQIAQQADVPVALVSYHFKGKLNLYREVFLARSPTTGAQRLAGLALAEMEDDPARRLELIVKAALVPMLSLRRTEGSAYGVLLSREANDPKAGERGIIKEIFDPTAQATIAALRSSMPDRSEAEIVWGFQMLIGAMLYVMADSGRTAHLSGGAADPNDVEATVRHLVALLLNGLRGPSVVRANSV
jgi:AcrR family transcriptional regulator